MEFLLFLLSIIVIASASILFLYYMEDCEITKAFLIFSTIIIFFITIMSFFVYDSCLENEEFEKTNYCEDPIKWLEYCPKVYSYERCIYMKEFEENKCVVENVKT